MGVLEAEERRARHVAGDRPDGGLDVLEGRHALAVRDRPAVQPAEHGERAHLVLVDVGHVAEDDLIAAAGLRQDPTEVPEHAARDVEAGFLPHDVRCALLEPVDRRVLAVLIVADLGLGHRLTHRGRRQGEGVAAELEGLHFGTPPPMDVAAATSSGATTIAGT